MKKLLLATLALASLSRAQTVTAGSLSVTDITHSTARIFFSTSGSWYTARVRVTPGTTGCESGTGGTIALTGSGFEMARGQWSIPALGLTPNTTYDACPEVSNNGSAWSGGQGISFTTDPMPAVHPVPPKAPATFATNYPDTTGFLTVSVNPGTDCSPVKNALNWAINDPKTASGGTAYNLAGDTDACHDQRCRGVVITVTAGSPCVGTISPNTLAPDVTPLAPSAFNTSNFQITSAGHGLTEGQTVVWGLTNPEVYGGGYNQGTLPGCPGGSGDACYANVLSNTYPFGTGAPTYVHYVDNNTFQIYADAPLSQAATCNGTHADGPACPRLWQFNSQGAGGIVYAPWPRNLKWIIVQSASVAAGTFLPEHVRVQGPLDSDGTPTEPAIWRPQMATFQSPNSYQGAKGGVADVRAVFSAIGGGGTEGSDDYWVSHIRFVGIEFTYQPYPQAAYLQDPPPGNMLINLGQTTSSVIFDRCWMHGWPPPFRVYKWMSWQGANEAIVDSYIDNMHFPRQTNGSLTNNGAGLGVHN